MDPRLLKFDVFSSPKQKPNNGLINLNLLPKFGERSVTSLLKYKNEALRQSVPSKQVDSYLLIRPSLPVNTPSKLSYSNSIKYIENFPENKLDSKVVKMLQPRYLKSGFSTKRLRFDQQGSQQQQQMSQKSEESVTYNVKYKFAQQAVKSQVKANLLFFKKSQNIPAQIQLLNKERENSLKQKLATTLPAFKGSSPDQTIKFNTYRESFLKSQKSNLHQKKQVETNKASGQSKHHKQTNSVQTQILFDEFGREISSFKYQFNNEQFN